MNTKEQNGTQGNTVTISEQCSTCGDWSDGADCVFCLTESYR